MMSDREALEAALQDADYRLEQGNSISPPYVDRTLLTLAAAARERLAQLPEHCGNCYPTEGTWGDGIEHDHDGTPLGVCHLCHGSGKTYPQETVEKIRTALRSVRGILLLPQQTERLAVAVLDALNETQ